MVDLDMIPRLLAAVVRIFFGEFVGRFYICIVHFQTLC